MLKFHDYSCLGALAICLLLAVSIAAAATPPDSGMSSHQHQTMTQAHDQPSVHANDPFTGHGLNYESLRQNFDKASMQAKIEQAKYKAARYKHQLESLGSNQDPADQAKQKTSAVKKQLQKNQAKLAQIMGQVQALKAGRKRHQPVAKHHQKPKADKTSLVAVFDQGTGSPGAMIEYQGHVHTVTAGSKLGPWRVAALKSNRVVLRHGHHHKTIVLADAPGHVVSSRSAYQMSGASSPKLSSQQNSGTQAIDQSLRQQAHQFTHQAPYQSGGLSAK